MVSLCITSFLFSTTVMHAYYAGNTYYHHLMLGITVLSIAVHHYHYHNILLGNSNDNQLYFSRLCLMDKIYAHVVFMLLSLDIALLINESMYNTWLLIFPYTIIMIWLLEFSPIYKHMDRPLHTILHMVSIGTVHLLIFLNYDDSLL
jgi:hypothetical protein